MAEPTPKEKAKESDIVICEACGGHGYNIEVVAECCGNYKDYGCCGIPNQAQIQVKCGNCDNGYLPKIEAL